MAQLILVCCEPSEDELLLTKEKDVRIKTLPVTLDAFVFLANNKNPSILITELSCR